MDASLTLRYEFADDDFGWLDASVQTSRISGVGGFWIQWQDLEEWAAKLAAGPLESPVDAEWGHWASDGSDYQTVVRILVEPADKTGNLEVRVTLIDRHDPRFRCETAFATRYSELERFATAFGKVMMREAEEAVLRGDDII